MKRILLLIISIMLLGFVTNLSSSPKVAADSPVSQLFAVDPLNPPQSCVIEPGGTDFACWQNEEQICLGACDYDRASGTIDCSTAAYRICVSGIPDRCPDLPPVTESRKCGQCRVLPTKWTTCTHPKDGRNVTFSCNSEINEGYEERGFVCGPCTVRNPAGKYKSCRCGNTLWREYCPPEVSTEPPPAPPFCETNPERCIEPDPPQ